MKVNIRQFTETAIFVARAVVLDVLCKLIPFMNMPQGGHISIAILPIVIIGLRHGLKSGLVGGLCFAIINFMIDGYVWHVGSIFFDYLIPFTCYGLSGLFKGKFKNEYLRISLAILLCSLIRYVSHGLSGVIFFSEYAYMPDSLNWDITGTALVWVYSFIIYNLPYVGLSFVVSLLIGIILQNRKLIYYKLDKE
jgi:thiamine transporter